MKELVGPASVSSALPVFKTGELKGCAMKLAAATEAGGASVKR
jgi:type VI secretion system secreted protein VgrG